MANSGNKSISVTSYNTLKFSWTEKSQSIEDNKTVINWTLQLIADSNGRLGSTASKKWSVTVNGAKYSGTNTIGISAGTTKTLASGSTTISHNADGTKTFAYSFSQQFDITFSGSNIGTKTGSGSGTLDTIPRKSSLTVGNGTLGTAQTLSIARNSSSFTHTITYTCGSASGTIATKTSSTSVSFTPPLTLASQNTSGTSVSIKYTLTTYNGNTSLGSNSYTKTAAIPASVKPSCAIAFSDPTGNFTKYGFYVKGKSKFAVTVTPTTAYGSTIASYATTANGAKYTSASFTTGFLTASGSGSITSTVTDKRGRTGTATASYTVQSYTPPVISKMTVTRSNENGTLNEQGEFVKVTFSSGITALNNQNTAVYKLRYKKTSSTTYTEVPLTDFNNVYSIADKTYVFSADSSSSYDVEVVATDDFETAIRRATASTGFTLMNFGADGKSVGLGKVAEYPFDIGLDTRFNSPVSGKVMGLDKLPGIPANSDLNNYMETGCFAVHSNAVAATIANIPVARAGRFEVISSTGEGVRVTEWSYLRQRYTPYNADNAVWERDITRSADNVWRYYDWYRSTLSKAKSEEIYHGQKVLWGADMSSGMYMTNGHTAALSEKISEQPNGIVLVFCYYNGTSDTNWGFQSFFVPKQMVALEPGEGHTFNLTNGKFGTVGTKYLYINDDKITGHVDNNASGTSGTGLTFNNAKFVLRYVIGV